MKSPLSTILDWLASLPESNRVNVYCWIGGHTPGFSDVKKWLKPFDKKMVEKSFLETVNTAKGSPLSEMGMIISLRGAIDFFICNPKDPNGWKVAQDTLNYMGEKIDGSGLKQKAREAQFRAAQTKKADDSWDELRKIELSDDAIRDYREELSRKTLDRF